MANAADAGACAAGDGATAEAGVDGELVLAILGGGDGGNGGSCLLTMAGDGGDGGPAFEASSGTVRLRGVELCEPCLGLGRALASPALTPSGVVRAFAHRAGIRADVLAGGTLAVGAAISAA